MDDEPTPVLFRKYGPRRGDAVLALFPCELGTYDAWTCSCYAHLGQHGNCDPRIVMAHTRPATPEEYGALQRELAGAPYGYKLKIYRRVPGNALQIRKAQLRAIRKGWQK